MHAPALTEIKDPGPLPAKGGLKVACLVAAALGAGGFALAYSHSPREAFAILLVAFCFFFFLGVAGIFFPALQYTSGAHWSIPVRRIAEGLSTFLIPGAVLLVVVLFGAAHLYDWAMPGATYPDSHSLKGMYLSTPGFWIRCLGIVGIWLIFRQVIVGGSVRQDTTKDPEISANNVRKSILFIIVFAMSFTLFVMDILMSLQSKFFSTMFGIYCFAGMYLSGNAVIVLLVLALKRSGQLKPFVKYIHVRDLGTWLMAFATFMMYVGFSQFMLIWYANLPDETFYFMQRSKQGWEYVFVLLPLLKWIVPFFVLMPHSMRAHPKALIFVCVSILVGQYLDIYWMVMPTVSEALRLPGVSDILVFLGVGGLFGFTILSFYEKNSLVAVGDPHLLGAVNGEHLQ